MFLDIGVGILLALGITEAFGLDPSLGFVVLGIAFALLPDIDLLLTRNQLIRSYIGEHRSATHYPILYLLAFPVVWFFFGAPVALLFISGVLYHFLHDTFFLGWGIKWAWPFSKVSVSVFHDRNGRITSDVLMWKPEEEAQIRGRYHSPHWIRDFYFRPSLISLTEYPVFLFALFVLYSYFVG